MSRKAHKNGPTFSQASVPQLFIYLLLTIPVEFFADWMRDFDFPVLEWIINPLGGVFNAALGVFRLVLFIFMIRNGLLYSKSSQRYRDRKQRGDGTGRNASLQSDMEEPKPDLPKHKPDHESSKAAAAARIAAFGKPQESIHPWAMKMLDDMNADLQDIEERRKKLDGLMDDFFGNSKISKTRYDSVIDSSIKVLHTNYEKAEQAAKLFNPTEPLPESAKQIILNYKQDSDQIVQDLNKVIVALLKTHQDEVIESNDVFDTMLDELVQTTSLYGSSLSSDGLADAGKDPAEKSYGKVQGRF